MGRRFFISDHHFFHQNLCKFPARDGKPVRHPHTQASLLDEMMIERHNRVVSAADKCYFGGDVAFNKDVLVNCVSRMNGEKILIPGNHDMLRPQDYREAGFKKIYGAREFKWFILTHYPVHDYAFWGPGSPVCNVHGHTHRDNIARYEFNEDERWHWRDDPRYLNISVEALNYTPISLEEIVDTFVGRGVITSAMLQEYDPRTA